MKRQIVPEPIKQFSRLQIMQLKSDAEPSHTLYITIALEQRLNLWEGSSL